MSAVNMHPAAPGKSAAGPSGPLLPRFQHDSPAVLAQALDTVSEGSLITDPEQRIVYANSAFTAVTGYSSEEAMGRNCRFLQGPGSDQQTVSAIRATLTREATFRGEVHNYSKDGTPFWNALTISPLRNGEGIVTHFVSVQRDITAQKALQERLRFLALHDVVTGLPNRAALEQHLSGLPRRQAGDATYAAVGVIDLDDFKHVNDAFGQEAGDALLAEFGHRIRTRLPESAFLARIGGDEFVVVIENLDPGIAAQELETIVGRLHEAVETDFVLAPRASEQMRMSLGMALCVPTTETGDPVIRRADAATYHLKAHKSDRDKWWRLDKIAVTAQPQGRVPVPAPEGPEDHDLPRGTSSLLPPAHRERLFSGGLLMYFQPVVNLDNGEVHLFEALSRLSLQDGTILPPGSVCPPPRRGRYPSAVPPCSSPTARSGSPPLWIDTTSHRTGWYLNSSKTRLKTMKPNAGPSTNSSPSG